MNIALIITGLSMGGAESQVVNLADRLAASLHTVLLISMTDNLLVLPRHPSVRVESLGMTKTPSSLRRAYRQARSLLVAFRPDVVHSHMVHANIFARMLRLSVPMPRLICSAHNTNEGSALWALAYRLTDRLAHLTTNVSREAVESSIRRAVAPRHKLIVMFNGIDCAEFRFRPSARIELRAMLDAPQEMHVLLAAGRFCEQKDFPNLLHAFARLCGMREDCVLWIASDGKGQQELEVIARQLGIVERIRFLGYRRDIPELMSAADVFVLSSAWEGFPLVIGEAMACERIVVSTDSGGVREWLGNAGYVVPVRDSRALAIALGEALALDAQARTELGCLARERVASRYSLSAVAARWEEIYRGGSGDGAACMRVRHQNN
ncbi:MAG: hypothetical protein JWQ21_2091 [Herminiimonas sp.]|nr:hypothetical protein [Herminiimonas sp.]